MRLPIAAVLVVFGFGAPSAVTAQTVGPASPAPPASPDIHLHTIAPHDTLIGGGCGRTLDVPVAVLEPMAAVAGFLVAM